MNDHICWECPLPDGIPTCDPSRARCPEPPLPADEQERVAAAACLCIGYDRRDCASAEPCGIR